MNAGNLRLIPILFLLINSAIISVNAQSSGDTWAQAKAKGSGKVILAYVETPAFVYKDDAGKLTGICVDIIEDFVKYVYNAKKVSIETQLVGDGSSFSGMFNKVKGSTGGVFGLGNITITEARKKEVVFTPSFITNFAILITHSNVPTLADLTDLSKTFGKLTAYTTKGTLNEKRMLALKDKYFPALKIMYTQTSAETLEKLINDPSGFAYLDLAFYLQAIKDHSSLKRHPAGDQSSEQFGFIMPKGSDWYPLFDEFFKANGGYTNSSAYKAILTKHLGSTGVKLLQMSK